MGKSLEDIAKLGAEWWGMVICKPKFDMGADSLAGLMCENMAHNMIEEVTSETRDKFVKLLTDEVHRTLAYALRLQKEQQENGQITNLNSSFEPTVTLSCDYSPMGALADMAGVAGVPLENFPWKTCMWITRNHVAVSYGYRANTEVLYANKRYWEIQITDKKRSIEGTKKSDFLDWLKPEDRQQRIQEISAQYNQELARAQEELKKAEDYDDISRV